MPKHKSSSSDLSAPPKPKGKKTHKRQKELSYSDSEPTECELDYRRFAKIDKPTSPPKKRNFLKKKRVVIEEDDQLFVHVDIRPTKVLDPKRRDELLKPMGYWEPRTPNLLINGRII